VVRDPTRRVPFFHAIPAMRHRPRFPPNARASLVWATRNEKCRAVGSQFVGDDHRRNKALASKQFPEQPRRRGLIALWLYQDLENLAFAVNAGPGVGVFRLTRARIMRARIRRKTRLGLHQFDEGFTRSARWSAVGSYSAGISRSVSLN
jgi:hypothetical protein